MQRVLVIVSLAVVAVLVGGVARAGAALVLDGEAYVQVRGYRYVEARRFERGWNRGVDVVATGGVVRAPVAGRVRFVGTVAGRGVVTIDAVVDGEPGVVTLTGVDAASVRVGREVDVGDAVGRGLLVHVGAYDPARRTRYVPVVVRARASAAGDDGASERGAVRTVGDAVVRRLADAIGGRTDGSAGAGALRVHGPPAAAALAESGSPGTSSPLRALRAAVAQAVESVAATGAPVPRTLRGAARRAGANRDDARGAGGGSWSAAAESPRSTIGTMHGVSIDAGVRALREAPQHSDGRAERGDASSAARRLVGTSARPGPGTGDRGAPAGGVIAPAGPNVRGAAARWNASEPGVSEPGAMAASPAASAADPHAPAPGDDPVTWHDAAGVVAAGLTTCLLLFPLLRWHRRSRSRTRVRPRAVVHLPREPLLPVHPPRAEPSLPYEPISWTDVELGADAETPTVQR